MSFTTSVETALRLMADGLGRASITEGKIKAYLYALQNRGIQDEDVQKAALWFLSPDADGHFPPTPVFVNKCLLYKQNREYREARALKEDPFEDAYEETLTLEEAREFVKKRMAEIERKHGEWPRRMPK